MPWTTKDVDKHKKGLSAKQKRQWVATANSALARCKAGKVKPKGGASCDAYAIKVANAAVSTKRVWSLDERARLVRLEFSAEFNTPEGPYTYAEWVFDDFVITTIKGRMYKIEYAFQDGEVTFQPRDEWVEVEHEFTESPQRVGSPIRAVEGKPGRYRAYAVRFNDVDSKDLYDTYFDDKTDYRMDLYSEWPWLYHHMMNKQYGHRSVGVWDEKGIDDAGVFVEGEITAHGKYREAVEKLIGEEVLYTSSQAIHSGVRVAKDGHVEVWPICEVSSTVTPGDWRMEKPISPVAMRAIEVLESDGDGGTDMSWKDELKKFIDGFGADSDRAAGDEESTDDDEQAPDTTSTATLEEEARSVDPAEVASALLEMFDFEPVVNAVRAIDETLKEFDGRLAILEQSVKGLAKSEPERMKALLAGEEWYENLFVASRDAPPAEEKDVDKAKQDNVGPVDETSVFSQIAASAGGQR